MNLKNLCTVKKKGGMQGRMLAVIIIFVRLTDGGGEEEVFVAFLGWGWRVEDIDVEDGECGDECECDAVEDEEACLLFIEFYEDGVCCADDGEVDDGDCEHALANDEDEQDFSCDEVEEDPSGEEAYDEAACCVCDGDAWSTDEAYPEHDEDGCDEDDFAYLVEEMRHHLWPCVGGGSYRGTADLTGVGI